MDRRLWGDGLERLRLAVLGLAASEGTVQERLQDAYAHRLAQIRDVELPGDERQLLREVIDRMATVFGDDQDKGHNLNSNAMTDSDARDLAVKIVLVYEHVAALLGSAERGQDVERAKPARAAVLPSVNRQVEDEVGITVDELTAIFVLDSISGFGPQKFKELHERGISLREVARQPSLLAIGGARGESFRAQLAETVKQGLELFKTRAVRQITAAHHHHAVVLTYGHPCYPKLVYSSNNPVPALYALGNLDILKNPKAVACVGSRQIRPPYSELHAEFARAASQAGFAVVSGFALGADTIGHETAWNCGGSTICVMPSGLDRPFPPENKRLWGSLLEYKGAVMVSEFPFGTAASQLTLRKRNKLIVALARGVLVSQTATDGGAMNAYRFAVEHKKPVASFEGDGTGDTSGNMLIGQEYSGSATLFPHSGPNPERFRIWLRRIAEWSREQSSLM